MTKEKQTPKTPLLKYILIATSMAFILLLVAGFIKFNGREVLANASTTIVSLSDGWDYKTENGISGSTSLPNILDLPASTRKLTLSNQLPNTPIPGGGIRFEPIMSTIDVYIDGKLITSYGEITDHNNFIYKSASGTFFVPLTYEQYGKEIVIELASLFSTELGMLPAPQIGGHHDFVLVDLLNNNQNILLLIMILLFSIILLVFYAIFQTLHNKHLELVAFSLFTILVALLCNSSNSLMWEIFNYADSLPALNAWFFFVQDGFLPILGYLILIMVGKKEFSKRNYVFMGIHGALYIIGATLQLSWILSINYFRPVFMVITLISYVSLFRRLRPWKATKESKYYQLAIFIIIGAQLADYFKYLLAFVPLRQKTVIWLNLELPFLFFLPLAAIVYIVLLSYALVSITRNDIGDIKDQAERDLLTGIYNRSTMETFVSAYIKSCKNLAGFIVIDINHFKEINDTWGHLYGDQVLKKVAKQLELYFGNNDIVARLGGDEFAIFSPNLSTEREVKEKAALAETVLSQIELGPPKENLSASVGFSIYPENISYDALYDESDQDMYVMKKSFKQSLKVKSFQ